MMLFLSPFALMLGFKSYLIEIPATHLQKIIKLMRTQEAKFSHAVWIGVLGVVIGAVIGFFLSSLLGSILGILVMIVVWLLFMITHLLKQPVVCISRIGNELS